jgi:hypothetical protein
MIVLFMFGLLSCSGARQSAAVATGLPGPARCPPQGDFDFVRACSSSLGPHDPVPAAKPSASTTAPIPALRASRADGLEAVRYQ